MGGWSVGCFVLAWFLFKDKTFAKLVYRVRKMSTLGDDGEQWTSKTESCFSKNILSDMLKY